ncbi:MAG: ComEC/Rec2 family competence protein, partial [Nitrososphaerales archaeon]
MTLVYLSIAFAVGILTGYVLRSEGLLSCFAPAWQVPLLVTSLTGLLLLLRQHQKARLIAAAGLFLMLGMWRYAADPFDRCWTERDLAYYQNDEEVWATVEGEVIGFPDLRDRATQYQLLVNGLTVDGKSYEVQGRILVDAPRYPVYRYGDTLRVTGLLLAPPVSDDFNYRRFLATRGIRSLLRRPRIERLESGGGQTFWRVLYSLREQGAAAVNRIMPEPSASLTA